MNNQSVVIPNQNKQAFKRLASTDLSFRFFQRVVLWLVLFWFSSTPTAAEEKGMLWRIEREGVPPSFLLGTAHVSDPRIALFRPELIAVLESVQNISLEIDLSMMNQARMASMMITVDGDLRAQLGDSYFEKLSDEMARLQIPQQMVAAFKPWAAALIISLPPENDANQSMDALIYRFASEQGKGLYALETIEEQIGVFEQLTPAQQTEFLKLTIDSLPKRDALYQKVLAAYLASDLELLSMLNQESMIFAPPDLLETLMFALIDQRNQRMFDRSQSQLSQGNALIAVGALHLPSEQGLLARLRAAGFQLSPVY